MFLGDDFSRTRPYQPAKAPFDHVQAAREEGPSIVQSFHESMTTRGGRLHAILRDVVAMANTNGGTVYVGVKADPKTSPVGVFESGRCHCHAEGEIQRKIVATSGRRHHDRRDPRPPRTAAQRAVGGGCALCPRWHNHLSPPGSETPLSPCATRSWPWSRRAIGQEATPAKRRKRHRRR